MRKTNWAWVSPLAILAALVLAGCGGGGGGGGGGGNSGGGGGQSAPGTPTNFTAAAGNGQTVLSWTAPVGGAASYNLYRATSSGGEGNTPYKTGLTNPPFTDSGLTNGTTYYYTLAAVNSGGTSSPSSEVSVTPSAGSVPTFNVTRANGGSVGANGFTLTFPAGVVSQDTSISLTASGSGVGAPNADIFVVNGTAYYVTASPAVTLASGATVQVTYNPAGSSLTSQQFDSQKGVVTGQGDEGVYGIGEISQVSNGAYQLLSGNQGGGSGSSSTDTATIPAGTALGSTATTFGLLAPGGPTTFGSMAPPAPITSALYQLTTYDATNAQSPNYFTVDLVLDRNAAKTDLQSVEYEGTVYNRSNTPGFDSGITLAPGSKANPEELVFNSAQAGITLPKTALLQLAPVIQNVDYTLRASVLVSPGGGSTATLTITGLGGAASIQPSVTAPGTNAEFDIYHYSSP